MITFIVPVKTPNPSNGSIGMSRGAAMGEARRNKKQREDAWAATLAALGHPQPRWRVTLTRLSAGTLDSHDNLRSACKHVADGIALALGVNDGAGLVEWVYRQEPCLAGKSEVRVSVEVLR